MGETGRRKGRKKRKKGKISRSRVRVPTLPTRRGGVRDVPPRATSPRRGDPRDLWGDFGRKTTCAVKARSRRVGGIDHRRSTSHERRTYPDKNSSHDGVVDTHPDVRATVRRTEGRENAVRIRPKVDGRSPDPEVAEGKVEEEGSFFSPFHP